MKVLYKIALALVAAFSLVGNANARFYDPGTGRWLSRDPIQEKGFIAIYGNQGNSEANEYLFCTNDAIDYFDLLGLEVLSPNFSLGSSTPTYIIGDVGPGTVIGGTGNALTHGLSVGFARLGRFFGGSGTTSSLPNILRFSLQCPSNYPFEDFSARMLVVSVGSSAPVPSTALSVFGNFVFPQWGELSSSTSHPTGDNQVDYGIPTPYASSDTSGIRLRGKCLKCDPRNSSLTLSGH